MSLISVANASSNNASPFFSSLFAGDISVFWTTSASPFFSSFFAGDFWTTSASSSPSVANDTRRRLVPSSDDATATATGRASLFISSFFPNSARLSPLLFAKYFSASISTSSSSSSTVSTSSSTLPNSSFALSNAYGSFSSWSPIVFLFFGGVSFVVFLVAGAVLLVSSFFFFFSSSATTPFEGSLSRCCFLGAFIFLANRFVVVVFVVVVVSAFRDDDGDDFGFPIFY